MPFLFAGRRTRPDVAFRSVEVGKQTDIDEAITTPTEESVRRAVAIQMILNKEPGLNCCENPWQGSFIVDELTGLVEEQV